MLLLYNVHNRWKWVFFIFRRFSHRQHEFPVLDIGGVEGCNISEAVLLEVEGLLLVVASESNHGGACDKDDEF